MWANKIWLAIFVVSVSLKWYLLTLLAKLLYFFRPICACRLGHVLGKLGHQQGPLLHRMHVCWCRSVECRELSINSWLVDWSVVCRTTNCGYSCTVGLVLGSPWGLCSFGYIMHLSALPISQAGHFHATKITGFSNSPAPHLFPVHSH